MRKGWTSDLVVLLLLVSDENFIIAARNSSNVHLLAQENLRTRPHVRTRRHPGGFSVAQAPIVTLARRRFEVEAIHLSGFWPRTCTLTSHRLGRSSFYSCRCLSLVALAYVTMVLTARGEEEVAAFRSPQPETRARICESELEENGQPLGFLREDSTRENSIGRVNRLQCAVYFIKSIDLAERSQGHGGPSATNCPVRPASQQFV